MWIARDKNRALTLFIDKPERYEDVWCQKNDAICSTLDLDIKLFPKLTWEHEPIEVFLITSQDIAKMEASCKLYKEL